EAMFQSLWGQIDVTPSGMTSIGTGKARPGSVVGAVDGVDDRSRDFGRPGLAAEVRRVKARVGGDTLDRLHQALRGGWLPEMLQHHHGRPERADRIGDALADDIEGRAMNGLEH